MFLHIINYFQFGTNAHLITEYWIKQTFQHGNSKVATEVTSCDVRCQGWFMHTVKPVFKQQLKTTPKIQLVFNTDYSLMQVKSIAECSNGSILQYFRPSLSYHFPLRPLFCLFLRQVLLYAIIIKSHDLIYMYVMFYFSVFLCVWLPDEC